MDHVECFMPLEEEDAIFFDDNNHIESDVYNYPTVRNVTLTS